MALTGDVWTGTYDGRAYRIHWDATQSIADNKSTVKWQIICGGGANSWYAEYAVYANINGKLVYSKTNRVERYAGTVASGTIEIPHNTDGSKSFTASLQVACYTSSINLTGNKTFTLNKIPRAASITAAPNFTDEGNPKIEYSNPAGTAASAVDVCISLDGSKDDIAYRAVSLTGNTYTFNLTAAERTILRNATTTSNTRTVRFYIRTTLGSNEYLSYVSKTLTITNATPTLNPTAADIDSVMLALTGDSNRVVRYYSNIQYAINAAALKGATIKSYKAVCGGVSKNTATGIFYDTEAASITFTITDSRGNTATKTLNKTLVSYVKPTLNMAVDKPNTDGVIKAKAKGNYFNGSFGAVANTIDIQMRLLNEENVVVDWYSIGSSNITLNGNTYETANIVFDGLDYRLSYTVEAKVIDKINTAAASSGALRAVPVFDWGADDFNINGSLSFRDRKVLRVNGDNNNTILSAAEADNGIFLRPNGTGEAEGQVWLSKNGSLYTENGFTIYGKSADGGTWNAFRAYDTNNDVFLNHSGYTEGKGTTYIRGGTVQIQAKNGVYINGVEFGGGGEVLWSGAWVMTAGHTADLSSKISEQQNGIVIVFSRYSGSAAVDWNWQHFFIPKGFIALHNGGGHSFTMVSNGMAAYGQKYIYVYDDRIVGHDNNNKAGTSTATNIKYDNSLFVMRYVLGV